MAGILEGVRRYVLILSVAVIAAAAPLRAWCEATCLAPTESNSSHCPTHEPAGDATTLSANDSAECPSLESARTSIPARLDAQTTAVAVAAAPLPTRTVFLATSLASPARTTVFERCTPLRI